MKALASVLTLAPSDWPAGFWCLSSLCCCPCCRCDHSSSPRRCDLQSDSSSTRLASFPKLLHGVYISGHFGQKTKHLSVVLFCQVFKCIKFWGVRKPVLCRDPWASIQPFLLQVLIIHASVRCYRLQETFPDQPCLK